MKIFLRTPNENYHHHHHRRRRRRHHLANIDLSHLLMDSRILIGFFCRLLCSFYYPRQFLL